MSNTSTKSKYLLLSRGHWDKNKSPEEIQTAIDDFYIWYNQLVAEGKFEPGHRLTTEGKLVSRSGITDGPFTETKEVIGGYWFIIAANLQEAATMMTQNPCVACGLSFEIRPIEYERASAFKESNETPCDD